MPKQPDRGAATLPEGEDGPGKPGGMRMDEKKGTLFEHLEELRKVIIFSLAVVVAGMLVCYGFFREELMWVVFKPFRSVGKDLVMIGVTEGIMTQLKIAFFGGIVLGSPVILWQGARFVLPALYSREKRFFWPFIFISTFLFVSGVLFGYFIVLEPALRLLLIDFAEGLTPMVSVGRYVSFVTSLLLPFGLIFQIPLVAYVLCRLGLITSTLLRRKRGYVLVTIFVLAAFLSPGSDVLTQVIMALPMIFLYEISILITMVLERKRRKNEA